MAKTARAIAIAVSPSKFPGDLEAIDHALADTPAEAARMRMEREERQILDLARSPVRRPIGPDNDMAGWE